MPAGDATYATQVQFEAYVEGWTTTDPDALKRLLQRAERDIDSLFTRRTIDATTKLKFALAELTAEQAEGLRRATCAQALYRDLKGEEFFATAQYDRVSGPDFSTAGTLPYMSPQAMRELESYGLLAIGGSVAITSPSAPTEEERVIGNF